MTITAIVIADSISTENRRLTTLQLRYPRFIHAEIMTHRVFSRNASSSRAIPVERLIQDVLDDTAMPTHWGKNQPGMQANEECYEKISTFDLPGITGTNPRIKRMDAWLLARDNTIAVARAFVEAGYHKQIVNRLLEPFSHINVVVTATEFDNFFELRDHPDAQPEIRKLAQVMKIAMLESLPVHTEPGIWHLPYTNESDILECRNYVLTPKAVNEYLIKLSVARCARVSYLTHEGKEPSVQADLKLYDRLVSSTPLHASPAEHQATPNTYPNSNLEGNFKGWNQYRKILELL